MSPGEAEHNPFQGDIFVIRCEGHYVISHFYNICDNSFSLGYPDYSAAVELIPDKPIEKISHN